MIKKDDFWPFFYFLQMNSSIIKSALSSDTRLDLRKMHDFRKLTISYSSNVLSLTLGKTRVIASLSIQIVLPKSSPNEGYITTSLTCSSPLTNHIQYIIDSAIIKSQCVDLESLCIVAGEKVWNVNVDLVVLDDVGNIVDAVILAAIAGLVAFKRPETAVIGNRVQVYKMEDKPFVHLSIHHIPVPTTFALFGDLVVVDPSIEESLAADGEMTVLVNAQGQVCGIFTAGIEVGVDVIVKCCRIAAVKAIDVTRIVREVIIKKNVDRDVIGR